MNTRRFVPALILALVAVAPATAQTQPTEKPFLWKCEKEGLEKPSYLYGTMHLPDDRITALHPVVTECIDYADALYGELALEPSLQMEAMPLMMLADGKSLKDVIGEETHARMEKYLNSKGMGMLVPALARMKPWAVASQLQSLDYMMEMQMGKKALDAVVYERAKSAGKEVGGLETIKEQIGVFDSLTLEEQAKYLGQSLDELEKAAKEGKKPTEDLLLAYLSGDEDEIIKQAKESQKADDETGKRLMKMLLDDRNVRMTDRIDEKLKGGKSHFFAIGTMHWPGEGGMIEMLEAKGYTVTRLSAADAGKATPKKEPVGAGK